MQEKNYLPALATLKLDSWTRDIGSALTFPVFDGVELGGFGRGSGAGLVDGLHPELVLVALDQVGHLARQLGTRHLKDADTRYMSRVTGGVLRNLSG